MQGMRPAAGVEGYGKKERWGSASFTLMPFFFVSCGGNGAKDVWEMVTERRYLGLTLSF